MAELNTEQKHQALFFQLVLMFQQAAWQQLGKVPNPITKKIERDLEHARNSIDMLDMLKARTKGNLKEDEVKILDHLLRELRLNYIDELDREKNAAAEKQSEAGTGKPPETKDEPPS
jgi:hypothetical protein